MKSRIIVGAVAVVALLVSAAGVCAQNEPQESRVYQELQKQVRVLINEDGEARSNFVNGKGDKAALRRQFIVYDLQALKLLLDNGVPDEDLTPPELTGTGLARINTNPALREQRRVAWGSLDDSRALERLIMIRGSCEHNIAGFYAEPPFALDELRQLAAGIVKDQSTVDRIVADAERIMESRPEPYSSEHGWTGPANPKTQPPDAPIRVRIRKGDEAVYAGTLTRKTVSGARVNTHETPIQVTTLAVDTNPTGDTIIAQFWDRSPEFYQETPDLHYSVTAPQHPGSWPEQVFRGGPRNFLPGMPRKNLRLGDEWELPARLQQTAETVVIGKAAARETVDGTPCVRIDVTPASAMPVRVKDIVIHHINPPRPAPVFALTNFSGHIWVAEDTGWVVKYEWSSELCRTFDGETSFTTESLNLALKSRRQVPPEEFLKLTAEIRRAMAIDKHRYDPGVVYRSLVEKSASALSAVDEFKKDYPASPYMKVADRVQELAKEWARQAAEQKPAVTP